MLCGVVVLFGDDLIGDQVHAVCGSEPVIVPDSGNVPAIHVLTDRCPRFRVSALGVSVFVAGFVQMMLQILLRFPSALTDGPELLRGRRRSMRMLVPAIPQPFAPIAHKGIVSPHLSSRKTSTPDHAHMYAEKLAATRQRQ